MSAIFKKGDCALCENYRPISLFCISYKIFAAVLLNRLKEAGAENRIWRTQFGFKSKCGTIDALFLARRALEAIYAEKDQSISFVALDWAKAFDSIDPESLIQALRRFGLPSSFLQMVMAIYSARQFFVRDMGHDSEWHPQQFGISQGCPLSPFLFVILMTILIQDARLLAAEKGVRFEDSQQLSEILYADDTMLLGTSSFMLQTYMDCIA